MQPQQKQNIKIIQLIDKDTGRKEPYILELDLVGKGFYGAVYKAVHQFNPNMVFAVKVISLQRQQTRQQILKQLQIIKSIPKSPNLVDTHKQHLQSVKHLYIFQQYCQGGTLRDYMQKNHGKLRKQPQIYDLFYQLSRGYLDLYNAGIIHEDIKPSNILIKGKLYKYCDFGVSKLITNVKHQNSRKGTVSYMPPQKLQHKFIPNARSDIYSLGVTLYEVVFGFHPYLVKKTKNSKEYLAVLQKAQLMPAHELLKRIHNPSLGFYQFIAVLEKMIARKPQQRLTIQQLKDILQNHQPFKHMKLPIQNQPIPSPTKQCSSPNPYLHIQPTHNGIAKSKIFMCSSNEENRLWNEQFKVEIQDSGYKYGRQDSIRMSKIIQQEEKKVLDSLFKEYRVIQAVINYLNSGVRYFKYVYNQVQPNPTCNTKFFTHNQSLQSIPHLHQQNPTHILHFITLKLNLLLMKTFCQSTQNYQKFYQQTQIWQEIQYLQAQVSKFIADDGNIKNLETKRELVNVTSEWGVGELINLLIEEFKLMFNEIVYEHCVRVNFKDDLMNGLFLLYVGDVLEMVTRLRGICEGEERAIVMDQSQEIQHIDKIVKNFNSYKTHHMSTLKNQFYKEFSGIEGVIYDGEENTDSFIVLTDVVGDEEEENGGKQQQEESPRKLFDELDMVKEEVVQGSK